MYTIYEKTNIPEEAVIPRLWTYHPRITVETFFQELNLYYDADNNPKYPILHYLSHHVSHIYIYIYQFFNDITCTHNSIYACKSNSGTCIVDT